MKPIKTVIAAAAGAADGNALHQMRARNPQVEGMRDVVVAAPPANIAAGLIVGIVSGSPVVAFAAGLGLSAVLGDRFEDALKAQLR